MSIIIKRQTSTRQSTRPKTSRLQKKRRELIFFLLFDDWSGVNNRNELALDSVEWKKGKRVFTYTSSQVCISFFVVVKSLLIVNCKWWLNSQKSTNRKTTFSLSVVSCSLPNAQRAANEEASFFKASRIHPRLAVCSVVGSHFRLLLYKYCM